MTGRKTDPPPERAVVERYLRRLDRESFAALLRDLYRERGWDATIEGGLVVATHPPTGRREVVLPVTTRWRDRLDRTAPGRPIDVVATTGDGTGRAGRIAARRDAECRTARDVIESLLFAVDGEATDGLCREHLGCALGAMRPPPARRLRDWLGARRGTIRAVAGIVVLAGTLALLANGALPPGGPSATVESGTVTPNATRVAAGPGPTGGDAATVRRLSAADVARLATAHREALVNRTFRRTRRYVGPTAGGNASVIRRQVTVVGRTTFRIHTTASGPTVQEGREVYYDGTRLYEARFEGGSFTYRAVSGDDELFEAGSNVATGAIVRRYLTSPNVTMTGPHRTDRGERYRVRARGPPRVPDSETVRNYTAAATVTPRGLVERLRVSYDWRSGGTDAVTLVIEYETGVGEPAAPRWYQARWG